MFHLALVKLLNDLSLKTDFKSKAILKPILLEIYDDYPNFAISENTLNPHLTFEI